MAIPNWLSLSQVSGSGDTLVTITADTNTELGQRVASLVVSGHTKSVTVPVTQSAYTNLRLSRYTYSADKMAVSINVGLTATTAWELVNTCPFASFDITSGTSGTYSLTLSVNANTSENTRSFQFDFNADGEDVYFNLYQSATDGDWDFVCTYNFNGSRKQIVASNYYAGFDKTILVDGELATLTTGLTTTNGEHTVKFKLAVPGYVDGCSFQNCTALTSVVMNDTVEHMEGGHLFYGCTNLTSVTMSNNLKTINKYKRNIYSNDDFGKTKIASLDLPASLEYIGYDTFTSMNYLTGLTIPHGCYVDSGAFTSIYDYNVSAVTHTSKFSLTVPDDAFINCDDWGATHYGYRLALTSGTYSYIDIANRFELVDHVYYAGPLAVGIDNTGLTEYNVRVGTRFLDQDLFYHCYNATAITIPNTVESCGCDAFNSCTGLTPDSNGVVYAGAVCIGVLNSANTSPLIISSGTRVCNLGVATNAFWNNWNIEEVVIPESVVSIGHGCFVGLNNLKRFTVYNGPKYIGSASPGGGSTTVTAVTIPNSIKYTPCDDFMGGNFGNADREVYNDTIYFHAPKNMYFVHVPTGITKIKAYAFNDVGTGLTYVSIPNTVKEVGFGALSGCSSLQSVSFPDSVEYYGGETVLAGCTGLTSVSLSRNTRSLIESFYGNRNMTTLTLPDGLDFIYELSFSGATSFATLNIGKDVKAIGHRIVGNRYSGGNCFRTINCYAPTAPNINPGAFYDMPTSGTLHYPAGADYSEWLAQLSGWTGVGDL